MPTLILIAIAIVALSVLFIGAAYGYVRGYSDSENYKRFKDDQSNQLP